MMAADEYLIGKYDGDGIRTYYVYEISPAVAKRIRQIQTDIKATENQGPMSANSSLKRDGMIVPNARIIPSAREQYLIFTKPIMAGEPYGYFKADKNNSRYALGKILDRAQLTEALRTKVLSKA